MKLLNDDQVRKFIVDGFVRLKPEVEDSVHEHVNSKLRLSEEHEMHFGNNIVSRIPVVWDVLRSPSVSGALTSLLGPNYYVHPHRAIHTSRPVEDKNVDYAEDFNGPKMGPGSRAGSGWHQDAQSPLSRARHHLPKFLIGFYFPHATPPEMGPTRFQAGSYLYSNPVAPSGVVLPKDIEAGTFFLLHFDTVHAGWPNRTDTSRYMVKFVFTRTENPRSPTWDSSSRDWAKPDDVLAEYEAQPAWSYIWNWMHGSNDGALNESDKSNGSLDGLNAQDQELRLNATYSDICKHSIDELVSRLRNLAGSSAHERRLFVTKEGKQIPRDDTGDNGRRWNERAIVMDDASYALTACGSDAVEPLIELLDSEDPWVLINAVFALGELGETAQSAMPKLTELLAHPVQQVVRQTLDAIGFIATDIGMTLPAIDDLLSHSRPGWDRPEVMRGWTGIDQVRMNAVSLLLNAVNNPDNDFRSIAKLLEKALHDRNGYVGAIASEALIRMQIPEATQIALRYLSDRRWDESVTLQKPF